MDELAEHRDVGLRAGNFRDDLLRRQLGLPHGLSAEEEAIADAAQAAVEEALDGVFS